MRRTVLALSIVSMLALGGCANNGYYYQANSGTGQSPSFCSGEDGNSICLLAIVGAIAGAAAVVANSN